MDRLWSIKGKDSIFSSVAGLIKKEHRCPECSNIFEKINPSIGSLATEVHMEKEISFKLKISMPMVMCEHCKKKVIIRKREFTDQIELALGEAIPVNYPR